MTRSRIALDQIVFARTYTLRLLDSIPEGDWFRMPTEGVTHVAWQVGHLAMAHFRLCLERFRGPRPDDESLISKAFIATFGRDSVAAADPNQYPAPADIRAKFDRVYARVLTDVPDITEPELDAPPLTPHRLCKTRVECLFWASAHEMLHAGQLGLLRRLLGHKPLW